MEPIISPWFFYWISVLDGMTGFFIAAMVLSVVGPIIILIVFMDSIDDDAISKAIKKSIFIATPIFLISLMGLIFVPSSDVMIKMKIAQHATPDKLQKIIEYGDAVKDELKQDVIDIIKESKTEGK